MSRRQSADNKAMSIRDIRALKMVLFIIVTTAVVFLVALSVSHQMTVHERHLEQMERNLVCAPEGNMEC